MSAPVSVTPEQYARWQEHLVGSGRCRNLAYLNSRKLTPLQEEEIVASWRKNHGTINRVCKETRHVANTVRMVLRERGLIL